MRSLCRSLRRGSEGKRPGHGPARELGFSQEPVARRHKRRARRLVGREAFWSSGFAPRGGAREWTGRAAADHGGGIDGGVEEAAPLDVGGCVMPFIVGGSGVVTSRLARWQPPMGWGHPAPSDGTPSTGRCTAPYMRAVPIFQGDYTAERQLRVSSDRWTPARRRLGGATLGPPRPLAQLRPVPRCRVRPSDWRG